MPETVAVMNTPGCVFCEYAMHTLEEMLKDQKTKEKIEIALDNICKVMPKSVEVSLNNDFYNSTLVGFKLPSRAVWGCSIVYELFADTSKKIGGINSNIKTSKVKTIVIHVHINRASCEH